MKTNAISSDFNPSFFSVRDQGSLIWLYSLKPLVEKTCIQFSWKFDWIIWLPNSTRQEMVSLVVWRNFQLHFFFWQGLLKLNSWATSFTVCFTYTWSVRRLLNFISREYWLYPVCWIRPFATMPCFVVGLLTKTKVRWKMKII